ncbi:hypothetical protein O9992_09535 [Vibrio lentus]|nr:hypothetical protein [Vibrio lentus]
MIMHGVSYNHFDIKMMTL